MGGRQVECRIDPAGQGAIDTITRAELVAILQALQGVNGQPCVIATDSKASMHMIQDQLFNPSKLRNSPHSRLLSAIGNVLRDRARAKVYTTIVKVKSHIGVHGNEMADKLANAAREATDVTISIGNEGHAHHCWPHFVSISEQAEQHVSQRRSATDLCKSIKRQIQPLDVGFSNASLYDDFWQAVKAELHPSSFTFWTASLVTEPARLQVLKARLGQIWTMNNAYKFRMAYMPELPAAQDRLCPLCHGNDSIEHMLGKCSHPVMKGLIIERHNSAARLILKEFLGGDFGALDTYADVGEASKVDGLELLGTRVPESVLADNELPEGPQQRNKLRPDILVVGDTVLAGRPGAAGAAGPRRSCRKRNAVGSIKEAITIIEVGYGSDTKYHAKLAAKNEQHEQLRSLLTAQGRKVTYLPVILGTMGSTYHSTARALQRIGISHTSTQALLRRLSVHAIASLHKIVRTRRQLEHSSLHTKEPPDPP